jgi:hypothetical protein
MLDNARSAAALPAAGGQDRDLPYTHLLLDGRSGFSFPALRGLHQQAEFRNATDDQSVGFMGPALQVFRGVLFAAVFYQFREPLLGPRTGWLLMGWMIALGILGTFAAPPGSLEGFMYMTIPLRTQFQGYLEIVPQALLLSALLCYWVNHPGKKWLSWTLSVMYAVCVTLPLLSFVAPKR